MKVSVKDFKAAALLFEGEILQTMNATANKFAMGMILAGANNNLDGLVAPFTDKDGLVDCDALKMYIDAGLDASGGELVVKPQFSPMLKLMGVDLETTIKRADFDRFFTKTLGQFAVQQQAAPATPVAPTVKE